MTTQATLTTPPDSWIGSKPEWMFYASLLELGYQPGEDFTYQSPLMGGRLDKGGLIIDFLFFILDVRYCSSSIYIIIIYFI